MPPRIALPALCLLVGSAAIAPDASPSLPLHLLDTSIAAGATCLDGSSYGVYYTPGTGSGKNSWLIYLQGGGWVRTPETALSRSKSALGSSKFWAPTTSVGGLFSLDPTVNPATANWHHVYLPYCDGASFSGDTTIEVGGTTLHMRGRAIIDYVMSRALIANELGTSVPFTDATEVMLTGCSAGGLATYLHADKVRSYLPAGVEYSAAPLSGFFLDANNILGEPVYASMIRDVFLMQNASGGVPAACIAATPASDAWRCMMAPHALPFITSRIFALNSHADAWQSKCEIAVLPPTSSHVSYNCSAVPGWEACSLWPSTSNCTRAQVVEGYDNWSTEFIQQLNASATLRTPGSGAFIHSCHTHCEGEANSFWSGFTVGGVSMKDAFLAWKAAGPAAPAAEHTHIDCLWGGDADGCNPTCKMV